MRYISLLTIFSSLLISSSTVWANNDAAQGNPMGSLVMMAVIIGAMYMMVIRPQTKRAKEHENLIRGLANGDEIVTTGGLIGKITSIDEEKNILKISIADNTEVFVQRTMVARTLPKRTIKNL